LKRVYSHPRSGTNFARATLARAFYPDKNLEREGRIRTGHWADRRRVPADPAWGLRGGHQFWHGHTCCFYVYRDGRGVAASLWRTKEFLHPDWRGLTFSEFLRRPLDWRITPGKKAAPTQTIVEHWYEHVTSWESRPGVGYVRYEDLLTDPGATLAGLAAFADREPAEFEPVGAVGPFVRDSWQVDSWRDVFTEDDVEYFFGIVPESCWALYEKGETGDEREPDEPTEDEREDADD